MCKPEVRCVVCGEIIEGHFFKMPLNIHKAETCSEPHMLLRSSLVVHEELGDLNICSMQCVVDLRRMILHMGADASE